MSLLLHGIFAYMLHLAFWHISILSLKCSNCVTFNPWQSEGESLDNLLGIHAVSSNHDSNVLFRYDNSANSKHNSLEGN